MPHPMARDLEITRRTTFAAAHRLAAPGLSKAENEARYGPCAREHGHTWGLEITVRGPLDEGTGMVIDFHVLDRLIDERIVRHVDHRHLNHDVGFLRGRIPTAENVALCCWDELAPAIAAFPGCRLVQVLVAEDPQHLVVHRGGVG